MGETNRGKIIVNHFKLEKQKRFGSDPKSCKKLILITTQNCFYS